MKKYFVIIGIAFAMFISGVTGYNYANAKIDEKIKEYIDEPSYIDIAKAYVADCYDGKKAYDEIVIGDTTIREHSELTEVLVYNEGRIIRSCDIDMGYYANLLF